MDFTVLGAVIAVFQRLAVLFSLKTLIEIREEIRLVLEPGYLIHLEFGVLVIRGGALESRWRGKGRALWWYWAGGREKKRKSWRGFVEQDQNVNLRGLQALSACVPVLP